MKYNKEEIKKGITLHQIDTDKFKTNLIAIFLSTSLNRENVTKNSVLTSVLRRGCKKFDTQEKISKELEEMYGAEFDCGISKIGKNHVLKFYIESINDEFLPQNDNNMLKKSIEILSDIIFNPLVENEGFNKEYVNQEKENIKQIIEAKKDNRASYASFRCIEEMYKDSPIGLYKYGYVEDLKDIDEKNLYQYYKKLVDECKIDIFVSGKLENIDIKRMMNENEGIKDLKSRDAIYVVNKSEKKQEMEKERVVEESLDVNQGKLVIGYDVINDEEMLKNEDVRYIGMLYNGIVGGSANSKLFQNVREKASLAYTTSSSYSYYTSNIFVNAGIDIDNYQKAVDIIKQQIKDMQDGKYTDEDIENVRKIIISNINSIDDEQDTEIIYFLGQELSGRNISLEKYIEKINSVTRNQIQDFASKIKVNTIYFLRN